MLLFYQVCFIVGLGYTLLSFIFGHFLNLNGDISGVDGDVGGIDGDIGGADGDIGTADSGAGFSLSPFKPVIIAVFLGTFGGVGMIVSAHLMFYAAFAAASAAGLALAFILFRYVYVPLYKAQNTSAAEIQSLIGVGAKVIEYIPQGGYGKITYPASGNTYTAPAKSESGGEIARDTDVVIKSIVEHTYYVSPKG